MGYNNYVPPEGVPTTAPPMGRVHRVVNVLGVFVPVAGVVAAAVILWGDLVGPHDLVLTAALYVLTGLGVTVGFHRLFTHRAFDTVRPVRAAFAVLGSMSVQGPIISWVADHRKHHAFTDEEGDPHSPHLTGRAGVLGALEGLWHAHVGWLFHDSNRAHRERYAPDLMGDPMIRFIDRWFPFWVALGLAIPAAVGWVIGGGLVGALAGLLWGGLVRIFLLHHVTFAINSVCHVAGRRPFRTRDRSTNFWPLALLSMGESWHNMHHADPTSARHGVDRGQIDSSARLIAWFEALGWATDVRWPKAQRVERARR